MKIYKRTFLAIRFSVHILLSGASRKCDLLSKECTRYEQRYIFRQDDAISAVEGGEIFRPTGEAHEVLGGREENHVTTAINDAMTLIGTAIEISANAK